MVIRELSRKECLGVLARARLARLACAHENQPYVVPLYLAYDDASGFLYGFTTPGQKVEWMRANPLVCVEVDEVTANDQWVSVIALGRYEELPQTPGCDEWLSAWQLLKTQPIWWEPASTVWAAHAQSDTAMPFILVYYRIWIDHVTGREITGAAPPNAISYTVTAPPAGRVGWMRRAVSCAFRDKSVRPKT